MTASADHEPTTPLTGFSRGQLRLNGRIAGSEQLFDQVGRVGLEPTTDGL